VSCDTPIKMSGIPLTDIFFIAVGVSEFETIDFLIKSLILPMVRIFFQNSGSYFHYSLEIFFIVGFSSFGSAFLAAKTQKLPLIAKNSDR